VIYCDCCGPSAVNEVGEIQFRQSISHVKDVSPKLGARLLARGSDRDARLQLTSMPHLVRKPLVADEVLQCQSGRLIAAVACAVWILPTAAEEGNVTPFC
jgi:hypothetical protein